MEFNASRKAAEKQEEYLAFRKAQQFEQVSSSHPTFIDTPFSFSTPNIFTPYVFLGVQSESPGDA